ncbi:hypothetical protein P6709_20200, partial [Jeotgalibacillus sp. ET6]|uniref:hypothetical protein n=1 Tax=Jeotgalibacillus sp. ET6 TaxID=3037260 RepID=UPI0024181E95
DKSCGKGIVRNELVVKSFSQFVYLVNWQCHPGCHRLKWDGYNGSAGGAAALNKQNAHPPADTHILQVPDWLNIN